MSLSFAEVTADLRAELLGGKAVSSLSAGLTSGLGLLVAQVAFATFIFSGALAPYASQGVGLVLFGNFAACLIMAMASGYRGVIAGLSPALVIGMAAFGSSTKAEGDVLFATVSGALIVSAVVTGLACFMIGRFRLANLLRFIPYPVSAGFVAGIGGAVCLAAMSLMDAELRWGGIPELLEPTSLARWGPGVGYGIALYFAMKRWGNALILPVSVAVVVAGYQLALAGLGISGAEAQAAGLLLTSTADGNLWPALGAADVMRVNWAALAGQIPNMLVLITVAFICVIMNVAGLEVAANQELDWDRELKASGLASALGGLGGGTVATIVVPASLRSKLFGAASRLTGIVAALVIGVALLIGDGMLELVPSPLVGGILIFAGLGMLDEGLVRSYRRLTTPEFGIIVLIFVTIGVFGLLEGVGAGLLATLIFFAIRLSRVDPIESRFTAREHRSSRARSVPERAILSQAGDRVQAYRLRGYIFFGSAAPLADRLRESMNGPSPPDCLLLDFANVSGFDFSGVNLLSRVLQAANSVGVQVVLSAPPERLRASLALNLPPPVFAELVLEANVDLALERCEETVIAGWEANADLADQQRGALLERTAGDLEQSLNREADFEALMDELRDWLDGRDHAREETIAAGRTARAGVQFLVSGRASAQDAAGARIYQCAPGDVVWPPSARDQQVAAVVADEPCRTMVLTPAVRRWLETHRAGLALRLYRYLVAERLQIETGNVNSSPE